MSALNKFLKSNRSIYYEEKDDTSIEIEIEYRVKGFDEDSFETLKNALKEMSGRKHGWLKYEEKNSKDRIFDHGVRLTYDPNTKTTLTKNGEEYETIINSIQKTVKAQKFFGRDKLTISTEETIYTYPNYFYTEHITRLKERTSFPIHDFILIELTKVEQDGKISYEVEVELKTMDNDCIRLYEEIIDTVKKFLPDNKTVVKFYNMVMTGKKSEVLIYGSVSRARDITFRDLISEKTVSEGILGGYKLSVKADGEHKFLIFHSTGVWILFPGDDIRKVGDIKGYEFMDNTIIAGELIKQQNMKSSDIILDADVFIPFDVTCYKGSVIKDIEDYDSRRTIIENDFEEGTVLTLNDQPKLIIKYKKFFEVNSIETFYSSMNEVLDERKKTFYKEDGIIITPKKSGYITSGGKPGIPLLERSLFRYTDICKWKAPKSLTIDLKYKEGEFFVMKNKEEINVKDIEGLENISVKKPSSSGVFEFSPIVKGENIEFVEHRKRKDKPFPNSYDIVLNLYNLSIDPIRENTLRGLDVTLMTKHFDIIKTKLLEDSKIQDKSILIDVCSGKGQNIDKFHKFSKVLAIEPEENNCSELAKKSKGYKNISILKSNFEDTDNVIKAIKGFLPEKIRKKVYISFMFSMSSLANESSMEQINRTIEQINKEIISRGGKNAYIIFVTINGKVIDGFLNQKRYSGNTKSIKFNSITIEKYKDELGYDVIMSDNMDDKKSHRRYPVYLEEFFGELGYKFVSGVYDTRNLILSREEKLYTSAISYGFGEFVGIKNYYYPTKRINVSTTEAIEVDGGVYMKDCDKLEQMFIIGTNVYRISVLDNGQSLIHSVMKLTSNDYGMADSVERNRIADEVSKKFDYNISDINEVAKRLKYQIVEFDKSKKTSYGDYKNIICIYKHEDGTYEPLVRKEDDKLISIFV